MEDIFTDLAAALGDVRSRTGEAHERSIETSDGAEIFAELSGTAFEPAKRGRRSIGDRAQTSLERQIRFREAKREARLENIAVLDMETDPFDSKTERIVKPFLAVLYSDNFCPIIIWEEDHDVLIAKLLRTIKELDGTYTIYAHNGGGFDFMFFIHKLRGEILFKGRNIMEARIGNHRIRDSFHLIPAKLASYKKDKIDYDDMLPGRRTQCKSDIIKYCISDCAYLLDLVKSFVTAYGFRISIGQAAMAEIKKCYRIETLGERRDAELRQFFYGGRVQCLQGMGRFIGDYHLFDVNSMYPFVMATMDHPISREYFSRTGKPGSDTVFLEVECRNNGGFVARGMDGETTSTIRHGRFMTTIWEYEVARQHGLISDVNVIRCIDFKKRSNFAKTILPMYAKRQGTKQRLEEMRHQGLITTREYDDVYKDDLFLKFLLNNMYGKFAQNGRKYKEHYITDAGERPPQEWFDGIRYIGETNDEIRAEKLKYNFPVFGSDTYAIWQRPNPKLRFNHVGTGASITGAARATLLDAICRSRDAIYCDTDSIMCRDLNGVTISQTDLGAWKLEKQIQEVIIAGKKLYAYREKTGEIVKEKVKSKGTNGLTWQDMEDLLAGKPVNTTNFAPTLTRNGTQFYMHRKIKATVERLNVAS